MERGADYAVKPPPEAASVGSGILPTTCAPILSESPAPLNLEWLKSNTWYPVRVVRLKPNAELANESLVPERDT
jgi:hypothetical protein